MKQVSIVGDFGGTNARLALSTPDGIAEIKEYRCVAFSSPAELVRDYLSQHGVERAARVVIAIAGAGEDPSRVVFTNGPWAQTSLDFRAIPADKVDTINDFAAVCYSVATFGEADCTALIRHQTVPFFPASLLADKTAMAGASRLLSSKPEHRFVTIGPGTGLGAGTGLVTESRQFLVTSGEGGHVAFASRDAEELQIKEYLERERGIVVSLETFACGPGLVTAFNVICKLRKIDSAIASGEEVIAKLSDANPDVRGAAAKTIGLFSSTLGACASAAALVTNARTIFIGGGILKKMGAHFDKQAFTRSFTSNDLGQSNILLDTPVMIIDHPHAGLVGVDFYLKMTS